MYNPEAVQYPDCSSATVMTGPPQRRFHTTLEASGVRIDQALQVCRENLHAGWVVRLQLQPGVAEVTHPSMTSSSGLPSKPILKIGILIPKYIARKPSSKAFEIAMSLCHNVTHLDDTPSSATTASQDQHKTQELRGSRVSARPF